MRPVVYHRHAVRSLKRMPVERKEQIKAALADIAALPDLSAHPNVKAMKGEWSGCFRLRVGRYRAIFRFSTIKDTEILETLIVGPRGNVY